MLGIRSWKTGLAGLAAIATAVSHAASLGWQFDATFMTGIITGIGLLFGKDFNVSGPPEQK